MDVTDVLRDRMQEPSGLQGMAAVSIAAHVARGHGHAELGVSVLPAFRGRGIFGTLDIEWVHFVWNIWVLVAVVVLLLHYRTNRWLWLTALFSTWHAIEHAYIFSVF